MHRLAEIDVLLKYFPEKELRLLGEGLWFLDAVVLRAYLEIDESTKVITIVNIAQPRQ